MFTLQQDDHAIDKYVLQIDIPCESSYAGRSTAVKCSDVREGRSRPGNLDQVTSLV